MPYLNEKNVQKEIILVILKLYLHFQAVVVKTFIYCIIYPSMFM